MLKTKSAPLIIDFEKLKEFVEEHETLMKEVARAFVPDEVVSISPAYWGPHSGGFTIKGEDEPQWVYFRVVYGSGDKKYIYDISLIKFLRYIAAKDPALYNMFLASIMAHG